MIWGRNSTEKQNKTIRIYKTWKTGQNDKTLFHVKSSGKVEEATFSKGNKITTKVVNKLQAPHSQWKGFFSPSGAKYWGEAVITGHKIQQCINHSFLVREFDFGVFVCIHCVNSIVLWLKARKNPPGQGLFIASRLMDKQRFFTRLNRTKLLPLLEYIQM